MVSCTIIISVQELKRRVIIITIYRASTAVQIADGNCTARVNTTDGKLTKA